MAVSSDTKPTEALEKALYSRLYNSTDLIAELQNYAIYNTVASQFHPDDYVVFDGPVGGGDENLDSGNRRNVLYEVKALSYSKGKAARIADQIYRALHDNPLTISEWNCIWLRRESDINYSERDESSRLRFHCGGIYRIRVEKQD